MEKIQMQQICEKIKQDLKKEVQGLPALRLASLSIGKDYASLVYVSAQSKLAKELGIDYCSIELEDSCSLGDLLGKINELNDDKSINGIIVNKPFPQKFKEEVIFSAIDAKKDLEGMNPYNLGGLFYGEPLFISPTVLSVLEILRSLEINVCAKEIVIVGFSTLIGKPLALLLGQQFATVNITHIATFESKKLPFYVQNADVVISAVGKPHLIKGEWVKKGAVVIDVGIGQIEGKVVGDVEFDEVKKRASFVSPVPGGVGRLTTLFLFKNLIKAAKIA